MKKNNEKMKKWLHTQKPRRIPGLTVVVVTFFDKILNDFHDFVSECVSFPKKINNQFRGLIVSPRKVTISIGRETKTHILPLKIDEHFAKISPLTIIVLLE